MKALALASLIAASAGAGAAVVVTTTYHYSSDFQTAQPINGAFNVIQSPANIWRVTIDEPNATYPIVVDINGDGVPDWDHPGVAVTITDIQSRYCGAHLKINGEIIWSVLPPGGSIHDAAHLQTPIVIPPGATVEMEYYGGAPILDATLLGRVLNY
jgi:hypothetical protein